MSFIRNAKEFFGLSPIDMEHEDGYYDYDREDSRYRTSGSEPKLVAVEVTSYSQAAEIGEPFRDGDAVVFDLTRMEQGDNKRVVDFAAGLCYALRGKMVNVTRNIDTDRTVFAITPEGAEFSQIELERAAKLR